MLPGFGLSLGSSLFYTCLILLLPLSALVMQLAQMSLEAQFFEGASIVKNDLVSSLAAVCRKADHLQCLLVPRNKPLG